MQENKRFNRKTVVNLVVFAILLIASILIVNNNRKNTIDLPVDAFQVKDTASIYKVFIADMKGNSVILTHQSGKWLVNNKYEAHPVRISSMLEVLAKMEIKSPVPETAKENIIKDMAAGSTKVELYHKNKKRPFHVFYVGGPTKDNLGTYMSLAKGNRQPHIIHIPGWYGYLSDGYFFCEEDEWRSKNLFPFKSGEIREVNIQYSTQPDSSFILKINGINNFSLLHFQDGKTFGKASAIRVKSFLYALTELSFVAADKNIKQELKDSLLRATPLVYVEATGKKGNRHWLKLYFKPTDNTTKAELMPGIDKEYFYGLSDSRQGDILLVQTLRLSEILLKPDNFLSEK